jgi:TRAP-type C4-dicarboxylate transport system substrate-binding protein
MRSSTTAFLLIAIIAVVGGCRSGDEDKAGNETGGRSVELVVVNHDGGHKDVTAWAEAVKRLSNGSITIRTSNNWRQGESNYERATLGDVRSGRVKLAVVTARAYDEVGVTSFQPLVAPLLIDDAQLERRVLLSDIGRHALEGTEKLGLVGLALVRNDVRRPVGLTRRLVGPEDYRGARVYTREGRVARMTLQALGAQPVHLPTEDWFKSVDGAEADLGAPRNQPQLARRGLRITANVVLWPQPITIVMNQDAFDELTDGQQNALRDAMKTAFDHESQLVTGIGNEDRDVLCRIGAEFVEATPSQLSALEAAVRPVYRMIERGPGNADALSSIRELKGDAQAPTVACPKDQSPAPAGAPENASELEGTYRTHLTEKELAESPLLTDEFEINDENWGELTLSLSGGRVRYSARNDRASFGVSGRYTTDGDVIKMDFDEIGETWGFRWSLYRGTLKLKRDETLGVPPELHAPTPLVIKSWERAR